ncbi:MAG: sugar phosphate isomerase/epimerase [Candidatus Eremiobacteraeota bacterium]|nr:sugar phosphate isomerase/epimerase [Candidatus Eremiobacteraeota bacterium]
MNGAHLSDRLGCSTITFRKRSFTDALEAISKLGLHEIDLGMLPGVCEHVPIPTTNADIDAAVRACNDARLTVRTVNADSGDLAGPGRFAALEQIDALARLTKALDAKALVLPCGPHKTLGLEPADEAGVDAMIAVLAESLTKAGEIAARYGVRLLVEALHIGRLCSSATRAYALLDRVPNESCGVVLDVSHVVAVGDDLLAYTRGVAARTEHVHLRDAAPGNINLSIGRGTIDFAAFIASLAARDYPGNYILELETHDIAEHERETVARASAEFISNILSFAVAR